MASACVNNIGVSPESFTATYPSYGWLSPRISFSRELPSENDTEQSPNDANKKKSSSSSSSSSPTPADDLLPLDPADFEFRLEDPVAMLPADKLFSDGKLVPLHLSSVKPSSSSVNDTASPDTRRRSEISGRSDPYLFSPKAPRCSSRWRELLGLKRLYNNTNNNPKAESNKTAAFSSASSSSSSSKPLKLFLHRSSKWSSSSLSLSSSSSFSSSDSLPLLKDSDCESVSLSSSRLSLSSSSSGGHEHDDLPRHSLDSDKPSTNIPISLHRNPNNPPPPRMRVVKQRSSVDHPPAAAARAGRSPIRRPAGESSSTSRGVSVDSPRMNSSGKIVFQSLERSSSSPSSFNGGPRFKHRGMERSYSANVRITPVLNVPVCSLRGSSKSGSVFGFGQLFSAPQKRSEGNNNGGGGGSNRSHGGHSHGHGHSRNRSERN
ncbi:hypothetical protein L484_011333 [Morus notabilis]|uniref:Uncharacterized protein n=1 Tax=Morus notabilis TaxID=981085 RepID=W9QV15_9ROSA|nr:uncharacterized serine-rich protein C215.13 [Morus notabilis]EXB42560.1 hypothetical protein L484_011333 [Morus notabilis]